MRRDQLDTHLRAAAAHLANPAHDGHAPALTGVVLYAQQFTGLQLAGDVLGPGQAIATWAVIDDGQGEGRVTLAIVLRLRLYIGGYLGVLNLFEVDFVSRIALGIEGVRPDIRLARGRLEYRSAQLDRTFEHFCERAASGEEEMQRGHADAQGQAALPRRALEGALGDVAPGCGNMLQQIEGDAFRNHQARFAALFFREFQVFLDGIDQRLRIDAQQVVQFAALIQGLVAWRAVDLRRQYEQAVGMVAWLQLDLRAPGLQRFCQAGDAVLAHLVGARAAEQQCGHVGLLGAHARSMACQRVANDLALQALLAGNLIELVQLQPEPFRNRAVKLTGTNQRLAEAVAGALQGDGEQLVAILAAAGDHAGNDQLVADGQVVLQRLAQVGHLARALVENDGLVEKVTLQVLADEADFRAQQFEQLQAIFRRGEELIEFHQALIQLTCSFTDVRLGQACDPAFQITGAAVAETEALLARRGNAQQLKVGTLSIHQTRILRPRNTKRL